MSSLAPILEAFFTDRLTRQRRASEHTIAAYRDTFRLLLGFAHNRLGKPPSRLNLADLDAPLIGAFLEHLERERGNSIRTRNARLAALHSFYRYAALREPDHAALIQRVLAIPAKRFDRKIVSFLTHTETDALLAAPDRSEWIGRRDHALLLTAIHTGLRVAELTSLRCQDMHLGTGAHLRCYGKGRKERCTPLLTPTVTVLRTWSREQDAQPPAPLFPARHGGPLSHDAVQHLLAKHVATAAQNCPSLRGKTLSPHVLRHTCAVNLLQAGVDIATIALWLGHEDPRTVQIYLHADLTIKERALARTRPPHTGSRRYRPSDTLLTFLDGL